MAFTPALGSESAAVGSRGRPLVAARPSLAFFCSESFFRFLLVQNRTDITKAMANNEIKSIKKYMRLFSNENVWPKYVTKSVRRVKTITAISVLIAHRWQICRHWKCWTTGVWHTSSSFRSPPVVTPQSDAAAITSVITQRYGSSGQLKNGRCRSAPHNRVQQVSYFETIRPFFGWE